MRRKRTWNEVLIRQKKRITTLAKGKEKVLKGQPKRKNIGKETKKPNTLFAKTPKKKNQKKKDGEGKP